VSTAATSASAVLVSWNDVAGETSYGIERSPDGVTAWQVVGSVPADATSFSDTGLDPSTRYFYRLTASNEAGNSAPSEVVSATTPSSS
jgi:titin